MKLGIITIIFVFFIFFFFLLSLLKDKQNSVFFFKISKRLNNNCSQILEIEEIVKKNPCTFVDEIQTAINLCPYQYKIVQKLGIFNENFMLKNSLHTARLYINTVKYSVLNLFYSYFNGVLDGSTWPPEGSSQGLTMAGIRRLDNLQMILEDLIQRGIKGDFIELGVWKGGLCILAKAIFQAYQEYNRVVFLADSFEGIPPVDIDKYPVDKAHNGANNYEILTSKYTGGVKSVLKNMNLYFNVETNRNKISNTSFSVLYAPENNPIEQEFQVKTEYIIGYFKDSLPAAIKQQKFKCFAVLRLDGDIYESTW